MNHLKSSEERKARWYSKQKPRYLPVLPGENWNDIFHQSIDGSVNDYVLSIPISWLIDDHHHGLWGPTDGEKEKLEIKKCDSRNALKKDSLRKKEKSKKDTNSTIENTTSCQSSRNQTNFLKEILEEHGFAVITGVLSESDCQNALEKAWDYIEAASYAEQQYQRQQQVKRAPSSYSGGGDDDNDDVTDTFCLKKRNHHSETHSMNSTTELLVPPVKRYDLNTHWSPYFPRCVEGGMLPFYGSGHSTFAWFIRSHPNVKQVFKSYYTKEGIDENSSTSSSSSPAADDDTLLSSLDGIVLWRSPPQQPHPVKSHTLSPLPPKRLHDSSTMNCQGKNDNNDEGFNKEYTTDAGWFHIDQNPRIKPQKAAIQGLVNILPVTRNTGGNVVVTKSHHYFPHHYDNTTSRAFETTPTKTIKSKVTDSTTATSTTAKEKVLEEPSARLSSTKQQSRQQEHPCSDFYRIRLDELDGDDWMEIDPQDTNILQPNRIIACLLGPGDMILWDSRTVHCSYPGESVSNRKKRAVVDNQCTAAVDRSSRNLSRRSSSSPSSSLGLVRAGAAISMMPRDMISESVVMERRRAVDHSRTLTHWVNKAAPLGEEKSNQVVMEDKFVQFVKKYQNMVGCKVLLEYKDLSHVQQQMVVGSLANEDT